MLVEKQEILFLDTTDQEREQHMIKSPTDESQDNPEEVEVAPEFIDANQSENPIDLLFGYDKELDCYICGRSFLRTYNVKRHVILVHRGIGTNCVNCNRHVPHSDFDRHMELCLKKEAKVCPSEIIKQGKSFICPLCQKTLGTRLNIKRHIRSKHLAHTCNNSSCLQLFKTKGELDEHMSSHTPPPKVEIRTCPYCPRSFNRKQNWIRHMNNVHNKSHELNSSEMDQSENYEEESEEEAMGQGQEDEGEENSNDVTQPGKTASGCTKVQPCNESEIANDTVHTFECPTCHLKFPTLYSLLYHQDMAYQQNHDVNLPCAYCHLTFFAHDTYKDHLVSLHPEQADAMELNCLICYKKMVDITKFAKHLEFHKLGPFVCHLCDAVLPTEKKLENHVDSVHIKEKLTCQICGKRSKRMYNHKRHMQIHDGYKCKACHQVFKKESFLQRHMQEEHPNYSHEKVIKCVTCDLVFDSTSAKNEHNQLKHRNRHLCGVCGLTVADIDIHMLNHEGLTPYKCQVENCGKGFTSSRQLKVHKATHSKERPFSCRFCDARFKTRGHLVMHIRTHTGDKRYKCTFAGCSQSFVQSYDLVLHTRRHTGLSPFQCGNCGKSFIRRSDLKTHEPQCVPTNSFC